MEFGRNGDYSIIGWHVKFRDELCEKPNKRIKQDECNKIDFFLKENVIE